MTKTLHLMLVWLQSIGPEVQNWGPAALTVSNILLWERYARLSSKIDAIAGKLDAHIADFRKFNPSKDTEDV